MIEFHIGRSIVLTSTHIIDVQTRLSERAIELLNLPDEESCFVLDIGFVFNENLAWIG